VVLDKGKRVSWIGGRGAEEGYSPLGEPEGRDFKEVIPKRKKTTERSAIWIMEEEEEGRRRKGDASELKGSVKGLTVFFSNSKL